MKPTQAAALVLGLVAGFTLSTCSTAGCNEHTCAGCCDENDECKSGGLPNQCGKPGETCKTCSIGQFCALGVCKATGGGTGGTGGSGTGGSGGGGGTHATGGGTGGGGTHATGGGSAGGGGGTTTGTGGGTTTCPRIASLSTSLSGQYGDDPSNPPFAVMDAFVDGQTSQPGLSSLFIFEYYYPATQFPAAPRTGTLTPTTFGTCNDCVMYFEDCMGGGGNNCKTDYLAQSGTFTVSAQTQDAGAGRFAGTSTNVHFVEWDYQQDEAVPNGRCLDVTSVTFDARWP